MNPEWTTSPNARRVLQHAHDARPSWLWSQDGQRLIWSNPAAALFLAKFKKSGLKLAPPAVPIKGQVARTIRLGSPGRTSLARIQFNAGDKPVSATCATTPLVLDGEENVLLIVAVDPIEPEILEAQQAEQRGEERSDEPATPDVEIAPAVEHPEDIADSADEPLAEAPVPVPELDTAEETRAEEEPTSAWDESFEPEDENSGATLPAIGSDDAYVRELNNWQDADPELVYAAATEEAAPPIPDAPEADQDTADEDVPRFRSLSALVDRLAADHDLFTPLGVEDDEAPAIAATPREPDNAEVKRLYRITGRGIRSSAESVPPPAHAGPSEDDALFPADEAGAPPPAELPDVARDFVERVSRYNFDELSRILNDRVGLGERGAQNAVVPAAANEAELPAVQTTGALVNLGGETLVLNRLPLGILVFRDQQILFANRAITEMVGYESVDALRRVGLGAVFPAGNDEHGAGPVNHLVQKGGTLVPVTARLQSTSWQGRPALMLSASTTEVRTGHEEAVRAFAQGFAELRGDGFLEASRSGTVRLTNPSATAALGGGASILGKPLSALTAPEDGIALRAFLERPGRFAETERPSINLQSLDHKSELVVFAQGQAGVVSGYFALVRPRSVPPRRSIGPADIDPALLARISRGVRRPLNTIIGFAELLRDRAFGDLGDERYGAYAEDIAAAGSDIAALVDELEDYARLREGRYLPERASLDMTELLETCVLRIRNQANSERVIVRNAISETLPRVTADRASLMQAVLNLLASAIDQSPTGSTVVISAQLLDDGGIAIHVRDSSNHAVDMAERFVVFRDGLGKAGQALAPVRSSVGLALTRSLLAVNTIALSVDPAGKSGVLFTLRIPADLVDAPPAL